MICPRSHYLLVAKRGLELQTPEVQLVQCSFYLSKLSAMLKVDIIMGELNVTLRENIFVFQLKNEELLCMYIGENVTIVTKINRLFNFQLRHSSKLHQKCYL